MNNEEKILAMLERIDARQSQTEVMLEQLQQGQVAMQCDIADLKADVSEIKERVTKIEVVQENVTNRNIGLLMDRNIDVTRKLDRLEDLPDKVEDIQMTVSILKQAVKK